MKKIFWFNKYDILQNASSFHFKKRGERKKIICLLHASRSSQNFHDLFWVFLKLFHSLNVAYFLVSASTCFFPSRTYSHTCKLTALKDVNSTAE